jgi:hypothetical protein
LAGDSGGRVALVEGGRVLLGWPGAPGWTTTGLEESDCCARAENAENASAVVANSRTPHSGKDFRREEDGLLCKRRNIFSSLL